MKSIGAVLRDRTLPVRHVSILEMVTCDCNTRWKLQSCVMSAVSVVRECRALMTRLCPLTAASRTMLPEY